MGVSLGGSERALERMSLTWGGCIGSGLMVRVMEWALYRHKRFILQTLILNLVVTRI